LRFLSTTVDVVGQGA